MPKLHVNIITPEKHINTEKFLSFEEALFFEAKIEELFSDLDSGIESLKKAKEQLKVYRQAVLKYAFEGKLTEAWRKENKPEPASRLLERIKEEREKHYQEELKKWEQQREDAKAGGKKNPLKPKKPNELPPLTEDEMADLPELPDGWQWGRFAEFVIDSQNGLAKRKGENGIPFKVLRLADIENGEIIYTNPRMIDLSESEIIKYELFIDDLLCIRVNGSADLTGKMIYVKENNGWAFCDHLIRFKLLSKVALVKMIKYLFNDERTRRFIKNNMVSTAGQNTVSQPTILNTPIPLIPKKEQKQIVQEIETRLSVSDNLEQIINENLQKSEALRQSILKKAFEGRLVPQDPEDEPAEKLLERIKAEKERAETEMKKLKRTGP